MVGIVPAISGAHRPHVKIDHVIRRLTLLLVALACCFALASCGDDGDGGGAKASGPDIPEYAKSNDERGAQGFARYWIDTLNAATTSGDTDKLKSLQKKTCETCTDFAQRLDGIYAAGGHVETKGFKVKQLVRDSSVPSPGAGVSASLTATPQTVVEKKGAEPRELEGGNLRLRLVLVRVDDHWLMDRIDPA
jgi:hypothetical protein